MNPVASPFRAAARCAVVCLMILLATVGHGFAGQAAPAAATPTVAGVSKAQVAALLAVLNDPVQRAKLIETLQTLEQTLPASASPAPIAPAPVSPPQAAPLAAAPVIPIAPRSLLPQMIRQISRWSGRFSAQIASLGSMVDAVPQFGRWLRDALTDPVAMRAAMAVGMRLVAVLALAGLVRWLLRRLLRPAMARLARYADGKAPAPEPDAPSAEAVPSAPPPQSGRFWRPIRLLPLALLRLLLDLLPVAGFALVGNLAAGLALPQDDPAGPAILALVNAYAVFATVMAITRMLVSPDISGLRLLRISDAGARYIMRWMEWLAAVAIFGLAAVGLGVLGGMDEGIELALQKLILLVDHVFLVVIVLQRRRQVAARLQPRRSASFALANTLRLFAGMWHYIAIFFIIGLWLVWAADLRDGYVRLWHVAVLTCAVLGGARLLWAVALHGADQLMRAAPGISGFYPGFETRAARYRRIVRSVISGVIALGAAILLLQSWGLDSIWWLTESRVGARMTSAVFSIGLTILIALAVWEAVNMSIDRHLDRLTQQAQYGRAARLRTILPILRTALLVSVLIVAALTTLGQIGVNIAPLLAGAGIIGVAIGFGSQKLVQDFITGIFLLLESAMQVGDFVTLAGVSGTVEHLSIRTIRLRAGDGSVHLIPFSSVTTVNNTNRGVGNAAVSVNIAAAEDTDHVGEVLKQIALEMRAEDGFKDKMRSDLQLWGVDKVDGAVVTLAGQIVCTDSGRWAVQREFNRRYKIRFQELGIELPNPTQTLLLRSERREARQHNEADDNQG